MSTEDNYIVKHYADLITAVWSRRLALFPTMGIGMLAEDWVHIAAVMEKCATLYHSTTLKYAVNRFTEAHVGCASGLSGGIDRFSGSWFLPTIGRMMIWQNRRLHRKFPRSVR